MINLPTPHGDKLEALLNNTKLPEYDKEKVSKAVDVYKEWIKNLNDITGSKDDILNKMTEFLNEYKLYIDLELIFDSHEDFLYRQKGQLKLDNSVIEEFLPILVTAFFKEEFKSLELEFGPTTCFSGVRFESHLTSNEPDGGIILREKDQDFAISKKIFIQASHKSDFTNTVTKESNIAYIVCECKTNLDKTMFQEAAATALDVKTAVPSAKYYLLCEWLDMKPINTRTTSIDEIIILRKAKRLSSNIRKEYNYYTNRKDKRTFYRNHLSDNPYTPEVLSRLLNHIENSIQDESENEVLKKGYF